MLAIGHIKFIYGLIDWQCLKILGYFDHGQGAEPLAQAKVAHDLSSYAMAEGHGVTGVPFSIVASTLYSASSLCLTWATPLVPESVCWNASFSRISDCGSWKYYSRAHIGLWSHVAMKSYMYVGVISDRMGFLINTTILVNQVANVSCGSKQSIKPRFLNILYYCPNFVHFDRWLSSSMPLSQSKFYCISWYG